MKENNSRNGSEISLIQSTKGYNIIVSLTISIIIKSKKYISTNSTFNYILK